MRATTDLGESYARCREIHRDRGRSYYLATSLLPAHKRKHVHALYAFTRRADDIVDSPDDTRAARRRPWPAGRQRFIPVSRVG